jgi:hypothetical protein
MSGRVNAVVEFYVLDGNVAAACMMWSMRSLLSDHRSRWARDGRQTAFDGCRNLTSGGRHEISESRLRRQPLAARSGRILTTACGRQARSLAAKCVRSSAKGYATLRWIAG